MALAYICLLHWCTMRLKHIREIKITQNTQNVLLKLLNSGYISVENINLSLVLQFLSFLSSSLRNSPK